MSDSPSSAKVVFWHRELVPLDGQPAGEHVVEATSDHVTGSIERHGEEWDQCYASLMRHATARIEQEVTRLGGQYAHVLEEHVESHRKEAVNESWLKGRFSYVMYRRA